MVELLLNKIPFQPYMMGWLGLYSSTYGLWAFGWYKVRNLWMYPVSTQQEPVLGQLVPSPMQGQVAWDAQWHI